MWQKRSRPEAERIGGCVQADAEAVVVLLGGSALKSAVLVCWTILWVCQPRWRGKFVLRHVSDARGRAKILSLCTMIIHSRARRFSSHVNQLYTVVHRMQQQQQQRRRRSASARAAAARPSTTPPKPAGRLRVYVISLEQDAPRRVALCKQIARNDLATQDLRHFRAIDGADPTIADAMRRLTEPSAFAKIDVIQRRGFSDTMGELVSMGAVGCALSHMGAWGHILGDTRIAEDEGVLILEDDAKWLTGKPAAVARWAIDKAPADWDIVLLGFKKDVGEHLSSGGGELLERAVRFFGTHAYLVNKKGIRRMLFAAPSLPLRMQIDVYLSRLASAGSLNVYHAPQSVAVQSGWKWGSRVQLNRAMQERHKTPDAQPLPLPPLDQAPSDDDIAELAALTRGRTRPLAESSGCTRASAPPENHASGLSNTRQLTPAARRSS